jgi:hypothetical protein
MKSLTQAQRKILSTLPPGAVNGKVTSLNPAAHLDLINLFLDLANKGSGRYPALHAAIARQAKKGPGQNAEPVGAPDDATIVDMGRDNSGRATARTWVSPRGGSLISGASTLVVDADSHKLLAFGTRTTVGGQLLTASTSTATAKRATRRMKAITLYHVQESADRPVRFGLVTATRDFNLAAPQDTTPDISAPLMTHAGHTGIEIALNRGKNTPNDCDYVFTGDNGIPNDDMYLLVPFVGQYTQDEVITGYDPGTGQFSSGSGLVLNAKIYAAINPNGTYSSIVTPVNPDAMFANVSVAPPGGPVPDSPRTLYWNWPFATDTPQASNPALAFTDDPNANYDIDHSIWVNSAFFFQFTVPTTDPVTPSFTFTICSYDTPDMPSKQCAKIPNLQFWWHCLAAGTMVTMADGSKLAIEKITNLMRVRTGHGEASIGVEATTGAFHAGNKASKRDNTVFEMVTEHGRSLQLSSEHPVVTPTGPVVAMDLKPGAAVLVAGGIDRVKTCRPIALGGFFYNLKLGNEQDRRNGILTEIGTFLANDILVGDAPALLRHYKAKIHNLDYMKGRLPEALHKDYESALIDIAGQC